MTIAKKAVNCLYNAKYKSQHSVLCFLA